MTQRAPIRVLILALALLLGSASAVAVATPAEASTFSNNYDGQDSFTGSGSTTLNYTNGHRSFTTSIWVVAAKVSGKTVRQDLNASYSITMYNVRGQLVWSATGQKSRPYSVGSNVTKIVITPNGPFVGAAVNWRRA